MAQEIKSKMDQLEEEQIVLENQLSAAKAAGMAPPASAVSPSDNSAAGQLDPSDQSMDPDNPKVTLKWLLVATLQDPSITQLNNTLLTLLEEFVTQYRSSPRSPPSGRRQSWLSPAAASAP